MSGLAILIAIAAFGLGFIAGFLGLAFAIMITIKDSLGGMP
jgi:hypothetical protein